MRAVILGATGFLGSNLVSEFMRRKVEIVAFGPRSDRSRILEHHGIKVIHGDFTKPETLEGIPFKDVDWLVHFASTTSPKSSMFEPHKDEANLAASSIVFQKAVDAKVSKILYSSSGGTVYGDAGDEPVKETEKVRPTIPYTRTKLAIESELTELTDDTRTTPIILRYGNPFGPNQYPAKGTGVVTAWLEATRDNKPIMIYGKGETARDYFYVSDAVRAAFSALESEKAKGIYNIGSGRATSLNDLLQIVQSVTSMKPQVTRIMERPSDAVRVIALDASRARDDFGWTTSISIEQGVALTWKWVQAGAQFQIG
jgi:UDP-glucose 4-epimerase